MKMLKNGVPIEIPEGTWKRLKPDQQAMYTTIEGESTGTMTVETIQTVQKKRIAEVVPVVEKKDDITGNPEPEMIEATIEKSDYKFEKLPESKSGDNTLKTSIPKKPAHKGSRKAKK